MSSLNCERNILCWKCAILLIQFISAATSVVLSDGSLIHMTTSPKIYTQDERSSVQMLCEFVAESFNLFDNPIVWRKRQASEESQVNMMGNLQEPFASTHRYKATYVSQGSVHVFGLAIQDISLEDSGNYSCEVSGPQNSVVTSLTHQILVRSHVENIILYNDNSTDLTRTAGQLMFVEAQLSSITCRVTGGFPPPDVSIYLGNGTGSERHAAQFGINRRLTLTGRKGLRTIKYTTERTNTQYVPSFVDDGSEIRCIASVPGLTVLHTKASIIVQYGAIINCDTTEASVGERNVNLRCTVQVRPRFTKVFWLIDNNGTTVSEEEVIKEHWILIMDLTNGMYEINLFMKVVTLESFKKYTLFVENHVARRQAFALLKEKPSRIRQYLSERSSSWSKNGAEHQSFTSTASHHSIVHPALIHRLLLVTTIVMLLL